MQLIIYFSEENYMYIWIWRILRFIWNTNKHYDSIFHDIINSFICWGCGSVL